LVLVLPWSVVIMYGQCVMERDGGAFFAMVMAVADAMNDE
jgi:hypothetical protein